MAGFIRKGKIISAFYAEIGLPILRKEHRIARVAGHGKAIMAPAYGTTREGRHAGWRATRLPAGATPHDRPPSKSVVKGVAVGDQRGSIPVARHSDDRTIERTNPQLAGRPDVLGNRRSLTLYEGMEAMLENTFMNIKNRSSTSIAIPQQRGLAALADAAAVIRKVQNDCCRLRATRPPGSSQ